MKKTLLTGLAIGAFVLAANSAFAASTGGSGILGSRHDLSVNGEPGAATYGVGDNELDRVCIYCHAPHNTKIGGGTAPAYYPLWNRPFSTITEYVTYQSGIDTPTAGMHANATNSLDSTYGALGQPGSVSKLCFSCHDGSIATDVYGSTQMNEAESEASEASGNGGVQFLSTGEIFNIGGAISGGANDGKGDLSNHHPIGFNYIDAQDKDAEIAATTVTFPGTSVAIGDKLYGAGNTQFECVTCHDVHNSENAVGAEKFLWASDANSNFCCTCHVKCN